MYNWNVTTVTKYTLGKRAEAWGQDTKNTPQADTLEQRRVHIWTIQAASAAWKKPRCWTRKAMCRGGESKRPSESTKGGLDWTGTAAWTSQLSSSNWCHMIQKGHVTPTATSCHPPTKAKRFCWKFGNFSTIIGLCVQNVSSEIIFPESKNIHSQIVIFRRVYIHFVLFFYIRHDKYPPAPLLSVIVYLSTGCV